MKKLFLLAAAALFALSSCVKENEPADQVSNEPAKLKLSFKVPNTKAYEELDTDDGTTLKNLTVFVLNSANEIMKSFYFDCPTGEWDEDETLDITTSARTLIGIGNTKENLIASGKQLAADVLLPHTLATLKKQVGKLEDITFPDEVLMYGIASSITYNDTDPSDVEAAATLELELIPSKLNVVITDNREDLTHADAWLVKDVAILYSAQYTHYVKHSPSVGGGFVPAHTGIGTGAYYYAGIDPTTWTGAADAVTANAIEKYTDSGDEDRLYEAWHTTSAKGDVHNRTFYVLPIATTDAGASYLNKNTIISIRLEKQSDPGVYSYFPTTFSAADGAVAAVAKYVKSGDAYTINITLKGSATTGGGTDPETPVTNATLTVTVTPKGWNIVNPAISKEFGS